MSFTTAFTSKPLWPVLACRQLIIALALAATDISPALQNYFGRSLVLILFGLVVAAGGAAALALWLKRRV
jgi:hypothetical protein